MPLDFSLTTEQEEVRRLAHQFAVREMRPRAAHYDEYEETPWEVMHKATSWVSTPPPRSPRSTEEAAWTSSPS